MPNVYICTSSCTVDGESLRAQLEWHQQIVRWVPVSIVVTGDLRETFNGLIQATVRRFLAECLMTICMQRIPVEAAFQKGIMQSLLGELFFYFSRAR